MTDGVTRRQLLGGLVTVGAGSTAAGTGTAAYFSDTEASSSNQVTAGTLTLGFGGSAAFDFDMSLAPTESTVGQVELVRSGTLSGSLDVDVDYAEADADGNKKDMTATEVAGNLEVTALEYGGTDVRSQISTSNWPPTVEDLATNARSTDETTQNDLIDLGDPGNGTDFTMELRLKDIKNKYQDDGIDVTVTFYLNQHDSQ